MTNPLKIDCVTNAERIMISDQISGTPEDQIEDLAINVAGQLMKGLVTREKMVLALIEHLINIGQCKAAGRIVGALGIQACNMRHGHMALLDSNPMKISEPAIKGIRERMAGADMGLTYREVNEMLGELPEF